MKKTLVLGFLALPLMVEPSFAQSVPGAAQYPAVQNGTGAYVGSAPIVPFNPTNAVPGVINRSPAALSHWRLGLANVRAGIANTRIITPFTDSTSAGFSCGTGTNGLTNAALCSPTAVLTKILNAAGIPAYNQNWFGSHAAGNPAYPNYDARVTLGTGWANSSITSYGASAYQNSTTTNPITFTPTIAVDTCEVWYIPGSATGGSFTANSNGGANLTNSVNSNTVTPGNGNGHVTMAKYTFASSTAPFNVVPNGAGPVNIDGMECYPSTVKGVLVDNMGWIGSTSSNLVIATSQWNVLNAVSNGDIPFAVAVIDDIINDYLTPNNIPLNISQGNIQTEINATVSGGGDPLLVAPVQSDPVQTAITQATMDSFRQMILTAAISQSPNPSIPVVDLPYRFGNWATANALGIMANSVHPNALGYADKAQALANALLAP